MRYRKLSADNDFSFGNGQKDYWRDVPEAVGQAVETRLLLFQGEWFLDIEEGTPYMLGILGKHSQSQADITIQQRVLGTQGVENIASYASAIDPDTRSMTAEVKINTIYGPTQLQVESYTNF